MRPPSEEIGVRHVASVDYMFEGCELFHRRFDVHGWIAVAQCAIDRSGSVHYVRADDWYLFPANGIEAVADLDRAFEQCACQRSSGWNDWCGGFSLNEFSLGLELVQHAFMVIFGLLDSFFIGNTTFGARGDSSSIERQVGLSPDAHCWALAVCRFPFVKFGRSMLAITCRLEVGR